MKFKLAVEPIYNNRSINRMKVIFEKSEIERIYEVLDKSGFKIWEEQPSYVRYIGLEDDSILYKHSLMIDYGYGMRSRKTPLAYFNIVSSQMFEMYNFDLLGRFNYQLFLNQLDLYETAHPIILPQGHTEYERRLIFKKAVNDFSMNLAAFISIFDWYSGDIPKESYYTGTSYLSVVKMLKDKINNFYENHKYNLPSMVEVEAFGSSRKFDRGGLDTKPIMTLEDSSIEKTANKWVMA